MLEDRLHTFKGTLHKHSCLIISFQALSRSIKAKTNVTATLWSPNEGINYPFNGAGPVSPGYQTALSNPAEFAALDTNKNGQLDSADGTSPSPLTNQQVFNE